MRSSGTNVHVASSVSPRAWCSSNVSLALGEREVVAVGDVGVAVVVRPGERVDGDGELALVDRRVPARACARSGGSGRAGPRGRRRPAAASPARPPRPRSAWCRRRGRCGGGCTPPPAPAPPAATRGPGRRPGRLSNWPPVSSIASPSPVSMALTEAIEIIVRMPGAISSAARPSAGVTGWWAWTRSPSPFQCCSASSRIVVPSAAIAGAYDRPADDGGGHHRGGRVAQHVLQRAGQQAQVGGNAGGDAPGRAGRVVERARGTDRAPAAPGSARSGPMTAPLGAVRSRAAAMPCHGFGIAERRVAAGRDADAGREQRPAAPEVGEVVGVDVGEVLIAAARRRTTAGSRR